MKAFITRKIGMTSTITEDGAVKAVTLLSADPIVVTQIKTAETDGYTAVQVGAGKGKKLGKSILGHLKSSKATPAIIREFPVTELPEDITVGTTLSADVFSVGDAVQVSGLTKGKGWAGTIKRHDFHRTAQLMVVRLTIVALVQLALCIHRRSLRVSVWLDKWVTTT